MTNLTQTNIENIKTAVALIYIIVIVAIIFFIVLLNNWKNKINYNYTEQKMDILDLKWNNEKQTEKNCLFFITTPKDFEPYIKDWRSKLPEKAVNAKIICDSIAPNGDLTFKVTYEI